MATSNPQQQPQQSMQRGGRQATQGVGSPISNEAYNVIAALAAKLEGLEAYRKYSMDAKGELWRDLTDAECKVVGRLIDELERLVKDGKLRMMEPGAQGRA
jgi:hypothetical protein